MQEPKMTRIEMTSSVANDNASLHEMLQKNAFGKMHFNPLYNNDDGKEKKKKTTIEYRAKQ